MIHCNSEEASIRVKQILCMNNTRIEGEDLVPVKCFCGGSVVGDSLLIVDPIVCRGYVFGLCFVIQYFLSFYFCNHRDREERESWLLKFYYLPYVL